MRLSPYIIIIPPNMDYSGSQRQYGSNSNHFELIGPRTTELRPSSRAPQALRSLPSYKNTLDIKITVRYAIGRCVQWPWISYRTSWQVQARPRTKPCDTTAAQFTWMLSLCIWYTKRMSTPFKAPTHRGCVSQHEHILMDFHCWDKVIPFPPSSPSAPSP